MRREQRSLKQQHGFGVGALGVVQTRPCSSGGGWTRWALIRFSLRRSLCPFLLFFSSRTLKLDGGGLNDVSAELRISQTCMYFISLTL